MYCLISFVHFCTVILPLLQTRYKRVSLCPYEVLLFIPGPWQTLLSGIVIFFSRISYTLNHIVCNDFYRLAVGVLSMKILPTPKPQRFSSRNITILVFVFKIMV